MLRPRRNLIVETASALLSVALFQASEIQAECHQFAIQIVSTGCTAGGITPAGLSDTADIVGSYSCVGSYPRAGVAWGANPPFGILDLGPDLVQSSAVGITTSGIISGSFETSNSPLRAYLYHDSQLTVLGVLPNHNMASAGSISNTVPPIIVGYSTNNVNGPVSAVKWESNRIVALSLPVGPNSSAEGVNDIGHICGWMGGPTATRRAFLWDSGKVTDLGLLPGSTGASAIAINNRMEICGSAILPNPNGGAGFNRAFLWSQGNMIPLGVLPGYGRSFGLDVNDKSTVVGSCTGAAGEFNHGYVWKSGIMKDLNELIPVNTGWVIQRGAAINKKGQIAAQAYSTMTGEIAAALLTPIPPTPGDVNCDQLVNVQDLLAILNTWGPAPPPVPFEGSPDLNGDRVVNVNDLLTVIMNWTS